MNKEIRATAFVRETDTNGTREVTDERQRLPAPRKKMLEKYAAS